MKRKNISLHELTALQVNFSGERARHPVSHTSKKIPGNPDHLGNIINSRPFVNSRKRRRQEMEEQPASASESIHAESDDGESSRRRKRQRDRYFPEVLPYLHPPGTSNGSREQHLTRYSGDGLPSSDLLKTIHHFASSYYTQRGLLKGASRTKRGKSSPNGKESDTEQQSDSIREYRSQEGGTDGEEGSSSPSLGKEKEELVPRSREKGKDSTRVSYMEGLGVLPLHISHLNQESSSNKVKDMYRAFDGSTLLLIGVLLQYHVASMFNHPGPSNSERKALQEEEGRHHPRHKERTGDDDSVAGSNHSSSDSETSTASSQDDSSNDEKSERQGNIRHSMAIQKEDERDGEGEESIESGSRTQEDASDEETTSSDTGTDESTDSTDTSSS